ncbi:glycosyltransferase family A protein [Mycoplasma marinum]|uniref:Glycosyltransferase 2-like domain-containing protein n=1 Tax=Mycoplasma marinum TaxID=1937190 RepID=A0A4R0XLF8_9MOLU|nr:glycosyltransferase family 2 protein [Mycoplasma marinum]TCG11493.1 hypothetical protein C4B24_01915 [Mycoplasma marinum]
MKKYKLAIIVPMFNMEKYISRCLESFSLVKNKNFEIVIVNDGSTDNSLKAASDFIDKNKTMNIKLINKENGHWGSAIEAGVRNCDSEYWMFLDADDALDKEFVDNFIEKDSKLEKDSYFIKMHVWDSSESFKPNYKKWKMHFSLKDKLPEAAVISKVANFKYNLPHKHPFMDSMHLFNVFNSSKNYGVTTSVYNYYRYREGNSVSMSFSKKEGSLRVLLEAMKREGSKNNHAKSLEINKLMYFISQKYDNDFFGEIIKLRKTTRWNMFSDNKIKSLLIKKVPIFCLKSILRRKND